MIQYMLGTSIVLGIFATILVFMWEKEAPRPPLALSAERVVKIEAPQAVEFQKQQKREAEKAESNSKEKEGQTKRAKEKAGKVGRDDAKQKDTVIPKGREDILREKVLKTGILSAHRPGEGGRLGPVQAVRAEQRRRAGDGRHGGREDAGRARLGRPVDQRLGHGRRRHRLRPHLRRGQPGHRRPRHARQGPRPQAGRARRARGLGRHGQRRRRHRRLAVEGADQQGRPRPPRGHQVLLRERAAAQGDARPAASTSSGSSSPTERSARRT